MIVGNGLIAKAFDLEFWHSDNIVLFASGVSNSSEISTKSFLREKELLAEQINKKLFLVYFSTCSIDDPELSKSAYVQHKREMENLVIKLDEYLIIRLPHVVGVTANTHTLVNYIYKKINCNEHFEIWQFAIRNFIDVYDVQIITSYLVRNLGLSRRVLNVGCPISYSILKLVEVIESLLNKRANYSLIDKGTDYKIDTTIASKVAKLQGITFNDDYLYKIVKKYYFSK